MTTRILSGQTTLQTGSAEQVSPRQFFISHRLLRTEPSGLFKCQPVTQVSSVITWEPVILPLLQRLAEIRALPEEERWPGADWPTEEVFQDARKFAERLPGAMRISPYISLADDGEVNFAWSRDELRIDLGLYGTGNYSYYARDKEGEEFFGDEISVVSPLPKELRELLAG